MVQEPLPHYKTLVCVNVVNGNRLQNIRFETKKNKTIFKWVETCRHFWCYQGHQCIC